ncbi:MAG: SGNH hydrolase domain-containing protein, partial [Flavobacteriaceae bacterium]
PVRRGLAASLAVFALIGTTGGAVYALTRYGPEIAGDPSLIDPPRIVCTGDSCKVPGHIRGVLYGDSHADRLRVPTIREAQAFGVDLVLPPKADDGPLDFVIIHRLWAGRFQNFYHLYYDVDDTTDFKAIWEKKLAGYSDGGKRRLLVVGPVPVFDNWQADCIYRAWRYGIDKDRCSTTRERYERHARQQIDDLRDIVSHLPNARFIDVTGLFCDDRMCRAYIGDSLLMRDTDHLSTFGSDWFYSKIRHHMVWAMTGKDESAGLALH